MTIRVAINGFGRMGRLAMRACWEKDDLEVVLVNDPACDAVASAHLLKFDSIQGTWPREVSGEDDAMLIDDQAVAYTRVKEIESLPLTSLGIDLVLECSGAFRKMSQLEKYLERGVRKVVLSAPFKGEGLNIVMGVNDHLYDPQKHQMVSAASCTTNCLAPVVKVIHENLGIKHGSMTTIHDITNTQRIIDSGHSDLRRARACQLSLIPTTTGSATAIGTIFPELQGKLNGVAVRVPVLNASITDCVFEVARATTVEEVNTLLREASETYLKGILGYETRPLVSVDYCGDTRSGIVDAPSTMVIGGTQVKMLVWYDNEMGYVHRMCDLASKLGASLSS